MLPLKKMAIFKLITFFFFFRKWRGGVKMTEVCRTLSAQKLCTNFCRRMISTWFVEHIRLIFHSTKCSVAYILNWSIKIIVPGCWGRLRIFLEATVSHFVFSSKLLRRIRQCRRHDVSWRNAHVFFSDFEGN